MITRALALGATLAAAFGGTAAATTAPPTTDPPTTPPAASAAPTAAATAGDVPSTGGNPAGCVSDAGDGDNLFPDTFTVGHAENYTLDYHGTYKVLTVGEPGSGGPSSTFVLVQCGTDAPPLDGDLAGAAIVEVPVTSMYSGSSSHYGFIDVLDIEDTVTGVGEGSLVVTPSLAERVAEGDVESFSPNFVVDAELVVAADPDVYVTSGSEDPAHDVIAAAGVPVVPNVEWLEVTPQGWAEWVGMFAALTNTEARANDLYAGWLADYEAATALAADAASLPTVLTGGLYEGTWYASGGAGIVANFIADAGGDYVFGDDASTGSIELDIESVLANGVDAEVWLLPQGFTTAADAVGLDDRLDDFSAWDQGGVWTNQVPVDPLVSFLEQGPVRIDDYLLDYVAVLHPELAPDHELVFLSPVT